MTSCVPIDEKQEQVQKQPIVQMINISKSFGAVQALKNVNLELYYGEVLGLVGDNAAGKSTLMKILEGVLPYDNGKILFEGREANIKSPLDARRLGIEMIFQDFALCKNMWVAGNIFMGREPTRGGVIGRFLGILDKQRMIDESEQILKSQNVTIGSCRKKVGTLSGGQQQSIAIARAIGCKARVIIMDEPTASLGVKQAARLIELIKRLRDSGVSIIYISHIMQHVFAVSDRIMVLKTGEKVGEFKTRETTINEVVRRMIVGKEENRLIREGNGYELDHQSL
ncbi:MAG: sugar ABC transporter ATP-binding protein [Firmicutes bacterium]|nr:sugar ABC transporter ATP-binding protein [Bacillota bacterium]